MKRRTFDINAVEKLLTKSYINCGGVGHNDIQTFNFTPAALEEPSTYLDTAIMEMMKKIMEAVTHLKKSFERKERNTIVQMKHKKKNKKKSFLRFIF